MMLRDRETRSGRRYWYARSAAAFRWLHIYLSMISFAALLFFAFTGLTLNHRTWFGGAEQFVRDDEGRIPAELLGAEPDKLAIAERLRSTHRLRGAVDDFQIDEFECTVFFKGPGYAADVFIDRETGHYTLSETTTGLVAVLNDLHKGRHSGGGWSWVIDVSAGATMLVALSGFGLLFYVRRRRLTGAATAAAGTILLLILWMLFVP
jgi:hypothetical protein